MAGDGGIRQLVGGGQPLHGGQFLFQQGQPGIQKAGAIGFYRESEPLLGVLRREALSWQQIVLEVFELA